MAKRAWPGVAAGLIAVAACLIAAAWLLPASAAAEPTLANWDSPQQQQVVRSGLMSDLPNGSFAGAQPLTGGEADGAIAALAAMLTRDAVDWGPQPARPVAHTAQGVLTVAGFDSLVVDQLGRAGVAAHVQRATAAVGLLPPSYYGTEVVARFLGLRYDHPAGTDQLELFPTDPITRAEAAWSLAQVIDDGSWILESADQALSSYALPAMTADELLALRIAVSRIGYPYVWAGTTDDTSDGLAHGGFDCSGFVWRVYKVSGLPWGAQIHGRTAAQMAGEIPRSQRLGYARLLPGDILFFGSASFNGAATESSIIHAGLYLGDNWVINSGGQGVYVLPLEGSWLGEQFAWGRRVLP
jgi:cell wall-associated NlpC family hydrolase